ncbi:MAG: ABC transporter permease [Coriobacteriia bacterium]|nr:ABC transporter permease [Coriobacteriia bacterium]
MEVAVKTAKNLVRVALLLLCASAIAFTLVSISPLDPLQTNIGQAALGSLSAEQTAQLESYWGVGEPPIQRYLSWLGDFVRGDMGISLLYRQSVATVIAEKLANSLLLLAFAWVISGVLGFTLGIIAGAYQGRAIDRAIQSYSLIIASTPLFWIGIMLLLIFAVWLQIAPIGLSVPIGMEAADVTLIDRLRHAILPALALSITGIANITLHTREKMIAVMGSDYVLFARARGESTRRIVTRHGVRNVILPAMTLQFALINEILAGTILVEQVFSYPGLGQAVVTAGLGGDMPLLLAITVISTALVFGGNFIANTLYGVVDPRIRKGVSK